MDNKAKKPYNKKEYERGKFHYQNVCFKTEEMDDIEEYCKENGEKKNTLIRKAVMQYIGKSIHYG